MNKKTTLKFNSTASIRPFAWLALAILAASAFGNSVQAEVWLNETFEQYTVASPATAPTTASSPLLMLPVAYSTVISGNMAKYAKAAGANTGSLMYALSTGLNADGTGGTTRSQGYISFKILQNASSVGTIAANNYLSFRLGAKDINSLSAAAAAFIDLRFLQTTTSNFRPQIGGANNTTITISPTAVNNVKIWYNGTDVPWTYPEPTTGAATTLNANTYVVYVNNVLGVTSANGVLLPNSVTTLAAVTGPPAVAAVTSRNIGKIAFLATSSQGADFSVDDIYAADSAPVSGVGITSATTATAQAGYPFSYTITSSGVTAPVYTTSTLPSGLSLNSSTGVISGTLSTTATQGLNSIELTATGAGGPATGNLALTITAPPEAAPTITSAPTASGFLTKAFTYQIQTSTTTPSSTPTSYAIVTGTLPAGLNLTATGAITGTPTGSVGDTVVTYTATNPFGTSDAQTLTITINPAPLFTWNNTGTAWSSANSWTNSAVPANSAAGDIAAFGALGSSATSVDVGAGKSIGGIVFNSGAYAYTWTGTDIIVGSTGSITNSSAAIQTFNNKVINNGGSPIWSSTAGGGMVFNGGIDLTTASSASPRTLTFAGAGDVTVSSTIASGGTSAAAGASVTFSSTGVNLLSGNNTYGGATTISAGSTLKIGSANALGSTSGNTVVSSGGALDLNGQTISGEPLSLAGVGISSGGALINSGSTDATWGGTVALVNSATYINASAAKKITLSGAVSGDAKGIYKMGPGTLELSGANSFTGTNQVVDGTMTLSGANSATGYSLAGYAIDIYPVLKVSAANALSSSVTLAGSSSINKTGTLDFTTAGDYTINQYNIGNMNFTNSSGSATTLTFTNATNTLSTGGGRTLANKSANLTITFSGEVDISGAENSTNTISTIGPVVISNRVFNSNTSFTRSLDKLETGTLTMYGVNSYNGTTTVSKGTLSIPTGGSLAACGPTVVAGTGTSVGNSANLNLAGVAGAVQVGLNGYVRGGGSMTSLVVDSTGTVEVPLGSTWTTGGTISFTGTTTKVSVTGTPVSGQTYTLMTATADITGTPTLVGATGWALRMNGANLLLEEIDIYNIGVGVETTFSDIITGTAPLVKKGLGTAIITGDNNFSGGTILQAGTLQVENVNGLGTGAVTLTSGTLKSTVDLNLGRFVAGSPAIVGASAYQAVYGANSRVQYSGQPTTINGPVTLDVGTDTTMTMGTLIGNSSASSLVTKIGAGTVKLMGGTTKLDSVGMALNGNGSSVLGGWRIQEGTVWFAPSSNNGGGNGPITLAGGNAKFTKLQNSNGTYTGFEVPSDLAVESNGLVQFDPDPVTLLGQNNLGFKNLNIGARTLEVATATTSTVQNQALPSVNFKSVTLTGSATLKNPANLDLNLQAVSGTGGLTKTGLGTLYLSDQPNQAAAFATLTGTAVESINVEYAGSGYLVAPAVTVVPVNGGSGAEATATIDSNGRVISIRVTAPGSGYNSSPRVVIAAPPTVATANNYTGDTTVQEGKLNLNGTYATSVSVKSGAALELTWLAPAQAKCSIDAINANASAPNAAYSYVRNLYLMKSVGGYQPGTFEFDLPAPVKADGTGTATGTATYVLAAARASATVDSNGFISALSIVSGGSGYAITPMVTIPAPTEPTVVATTTGSITFESGATLALNIGSPTSASYTLVTANGGISGNPTLEPAISGYTLKKSTDGKSLILDQNDTTKPEIALIGASSVNVDFGSIYTDPGATLNDNKDAARPINGTGSVNTSVPGSYTITFNGADAAGNVADTVTRTVVVGAAPVTDGYSLYLSSNGVPAGTAFNAKVNGVTVGLAYAFGSSNGSPRNNGVTAVPVMSGNQLTYTFDAKDDPALTVTYQTSSDLVTWSAAQPVSAGTGSSTEGFVKKQAQATGSGKLFIKINVTR